MGTETGSLIFKCCYLQYLIKAMQKDRKYSSTAQTEEKDGTEIEVCFVPILVLLNSSPEI